MQGLTRLAARQSACERGRWCTGDALPETGVTVYSAGLGDTRPLEGGMPWKECHVVDERLRFVARLLDGEKDGRVV